MIGKYGLWVYRYPKMKHSPMYPEIEYPPVYTKIKIVAIQDGKYVVNPIHLSGHTLELNEKEVFIITRKNS